MRSAPLFLLAAVACGDSGSQPVDAGEDGGDLGIGVRVEVTSVPEIPGTFESSDFAPSLDDMRIRLVDFRVVGDANPTAKNMVNLRWNAPVELVNFENAPIGQYSRVRASMTSFEASGTLQLDSQQHEWEIEDEPPGGIEIDLVISIDLEPGAAETVRLEADFTDIFAAVDWANVPEDEGVLEVSEGSSEIDAVRALLGGMFRIAGGPPS